MKCDLCGEEMKFQGTINWWCSKDKLSYHSHPISEIRSIIDCALSEGLPWQKDLARQMKPKIDDYKDDVVSYVITKDNKIWLMEEWQRVLKLKAFL